MASTLRFDNWEDSNGTPILDGTNLALPSSALPAGSVLQVVSTTKTDTFSSSSTSMVDITGLSANITPTAANSKIMIIATVNTSSDTNMTCGLQLVRNTTAISIGDSAGSRTRTSQSFRGKSANDGFTTSINFLDSPATTSSVTYKLQGKIETNGFNFYINRSDTDGDGSAYYRGASTITLMEIAG